MVPLKETVHLENKITQMGIAVLFILHHNSLNSKTGQKGNHVF